MLLAGKVAIISGAGPGVGRSVALAFAGEGAELVLVGRSEEKSKAIAEELEAGGKAPLIVRADITDPDGCNRVVYKTMERFGRIDVLVNNAFATGRTEPVMKTDLQKWKTPFLVNVIGSMQLSQAVAPVMKSSGGGAIVMVGTLASRKVQPGMAAYGASKAALLHATQHLATEIGNDGIRVNTVVPSHIDGPNLRYYFEMEAKRRGIDPKAVYDEVAAEGVMGHVATSEEVAKAILFFASPMSSAITGQSLDVNTGQWFE